MNVSLVGSVGTAINDSMTSPARVASPVTGSSPTSTSSLTENPSGVSANSPSSAQIAQAVSNANDAFAQKNQNLYASIEIDKATGMGVVKIMDKDSQQTVSQYPSKAIVEIAQALQNPSSTGQLIHTKA
ncbi:MAG: flagellar protein FlaG [Gallionella sp.]|jgi:uncharacterized FlaG/YvyC family protein